MTSVGLTLDQVRGDPLAGTQWLYALAPDLPCNRSPALGISCFPTANQIG